MSLGAGDKTETATPKRLGEARKKGQVAKSTDLNGAIVLVAGLVAVSVIGPAVVSGTTESMRSTFALIARPGAATTAAGLHGLFQSALHTVLATAAPIGGICLGAAVLVNVAQVSFRPSFGAIKPEFSKINPMKGAKNIFGPRIAFEGAKAVTKVSVVGAVVAMTLLPQLTNLGASVGTPPAALGKLISSGAMGIAERAAIAYVLIGIVDLIYQKRRHNKSMKMSKHEVKEEFKSYNAPPEVRAALRRRQMQAARARMMAAVPQADVVVTNPTHFAVALSYDGNHPAPIVVAKGQDLVAKQIRRIAEENNVPIVPDPPLARSLHGMVEIGQMIPAELYAAVAQVLAFVYRIAGRRKASA
jgi:flagellar biosynthetic protein FlhB